MLSISLTGVILVWKKEYLWLSVDGAREQIDTGLLANAIEKIEASYAADEVTFVQLYSEDLSIHKVFLSGRRYAWHTQYGDKVQIWSGNQRWEDFFLDLHHRFLLGNTIGLNIAGFGGLLALPLLVLGLILWWPRRRLLSLGIKPKSFRRGALMVSHANIGAIFSLPILLLTITGVILVYPVESRFVLLDSIGANGPAIIERSTFDASDGLPTWSTAIALARQTFPQSNIRSVQPSSTKSNKISLNIQQKDGWHRLGRSSLRFHANGELVIQDELAQWKAKRVFSFSYPLHTAKLGLIYRLFLTLVGLGFALLSLLGVLSYLKRNS
ncbi:MAG: putative iron-regulated membrane protein [Arenicella sp.]|jgi:uncharacterized iron-regulated membrane protein